MIWVPILRPPNGLSRFQQRFLLQPDPRAARSLGGVLLSWDAAFLGTMLVVLAMGDLQVW